MKNTKMWFLLIFAMVIIIAMLSGCLYDPEETSPSGDTPSATESTEDSFNIDDWRRKTESTIITSDNVPENPSGATSTTETDEKTTTDGTTNVQASEEEKIERDYVLNTNTMKFHLPTCSSVKDIKPENREDYHGTRENVITKGYDPCGRCKP